MLFAVTKWNMIFLTDCCDGRKRNCRAHWLFLIWWKTSWHHHPCHFLFFALLLLYCSFLTCSCFLSFLSSLNFRSHDFFASLNLFFLHFSPAFTFFDPNDPACLEILMDPRTTIPELFAIVRQWVPQVQHKIDVIGNEVRTHWNATTFFWPFCQLAEIVKLKILVLVVFFCGKKDAIHFQIKVWGEDLQLFFISYHQNLNHTIKTITHQQWEKNKNLCILCNIKNRTKLQN